jgi:hypothetical protein
LSAGDATVIAAAERPIFMGPPGSPDHADLKLQPGEHRTG